MPSWSLQLEGKVFDGVEVVPTSHVDMKDKILHIHMARGDDLHAIKYLPLKLKGPARHWLKGLPESSIGSWEELEYAFRAIFKGLMSDLRMRTI